MWQKGSRNVEAKRCITPAAADNTLWVVALLCRWRFRSFVETAARRVAAELLRYTALNHPSTVVKSKAEKSRLTKSQNTIIGIAGLVILLIVYLIAGVVSILIKQSYPLVIALGIQIGMQLVSGYAISSVGTMVIDRREESGLYWLSITAQTIIAIWVSVEILRYGSG